jgi:hypothetical protein
MKHRVFQYKKPILIADELTATRIEELQEHYDKMIKKKGLCLQTCVFNLVFSGNRFFFAIVASILTGISASILTNFLDFSDYRPEKQMKVILLLICVAVFAGALTLLTAKITQVQESGASFVATENRRLSYSQTMSAQHNIVYSNCLNSIKYIMLFYCVSVLSGAFTVMFLFWGHSIISFVKGLILWLRCLL